MQAIVTISYWKDIEHLHAFAHGPTHRLGWDVRHFSEFLPLHFAPLDKLLYVVMLTWKSASGGLRRTRSIPISGSCIRRTLCRKVDGKTYIKIAIPSAWVSQGYRKWFYDFG